MEEFLRRCKNELCVGLVRNEKDWLRSFYYDVEKGLRQNESDGEFVEVSLRSLHQIKRVICNEMQSSTISSWLPLDRKLMTLDRLQRGRNSVFGGSIFCKESSVECLLGCNPVSRMPCILFGYLTFKPHSLVGSAATGSLFVEDNLGALVCEIINPDKQHVDNLVLIPEWNYVPSRFSMSLKQSRNADCVDKSSDLRDLSPGYIEVIGHCAPLNSVDSRRHVNKPLEFLTIHDFQQDGSSTVNFNIYGNIFALSPIHSLNIGKPFFFVKLSCLDTNLTTVVVVQGEQFMAWHNFLQIDELYIFRKLRETTMNKVWDLTVTGTKNERKILATTRHSDFQKYQSSTSVRILRGEKRSYKEHMIESKRLKTEREQDDLKENVKENLTAVSQNSIKADVPFTKLRPKAPSNMSYTGVITKCLKPEAGVYELDAKILLYINHQPRSNLARGLRVGAQVTVYNVHLYRRGKKVLGFCCCTQSTVRVVKFSPFETPWKPFSPCESPLALLGQNLTLADYVDLLEMCEKVLEKFSPLYRTNQLVAYSARKESRTTNKSSVLEQLLSHVKTQSSSRTVPLRNIYDEFFEVPHQCHPNRERELTFASLPTLKEFLAAINEKSCNEPWLNGILSEMSSSSQEKQDWMYKVLTQDFLSTPVILVGCLRHSPKTGQLLLFDQTGEICCIVASADQQTKGHMCAKDCCKRLVSMGVEKSSTSCPSTQIWHLDALIQINKFEVVIEKFQTNNCVLDNLVADSTRRYLQFSFDNVEVLISKDADKKADSRHDKRNVGSKKEKSETCIKSEELDEKPDGNAFICKILFMVRNCEVPTLRRMKDELCFPCGVEVRIVAVRSSKIQEGAVSKSHCASEESTLCSSESNKFLSGFKLQSKDAALKLVKRNLVWSRALHPGCFYVITETVSNEACSRILKDGVLEPLISVNSAMQLDRVCWCENCALTGKPVDIDSNAEIVQTLNSLREDFFRYDMLCCVDSVLTDSALRKGEKESTSFQARYAPTAQVSFRGVIVSRELRQSDTPSQRLPNGLVEVPKFGPMKASVVKDLQLSFAFLTNNIIQLRVRDLESPNTISVYLDLRRTNYICGLLPGATVQFRRFVRKFSRSKNMYCTFEACSSLVVEKRAVPTFSDAPLNPGPSVTRKVLNLAEENTKQLPNVNLMELIRSEDEGNFVQTISRVRCRVTIVQKASLRWLCKRCGELVTRNECIGGCYGTVGYKFHAEARCVVEDGTGEAQVYVYDDLVPTILKLTCQRWLNLQDLAMRNGELLYQRYWRCANRGPQITKGDVLSREADAKKSLEDYCCSPQFQRLIVLHCKLFRFSKTTAGKTDEGYETRSINIAGTEHGTLVLPKLLLRAESITEVRAVNEIRQLLTVIHTEQS